MSKQVNTVTGPIDSNQLGLTLPHEHIIVDFIGADQSGPDRYSRDEVKDVMRPYLEELLRYGVRSFVECTPMYLARDPLIFRDLATEVGLNIITNTGQYKEPFLPEKTFKIDAVELADSWIAEFEQGIGDTGVRPGFVKTAVEAVSLAPTQRKVIRAAAIVSRQTGLTVATHTGVASSALEIIDILKMEEVDPVKWIFVHAQNEGDMQKLLEVARTGAWISLDGLSEDSAARHLDSLFALIGAGFEDRVLLSHDAGWYHVGEERGGTVRPFTYLFESFIPMAEAAGVKRDILEKITSVNPGNAYAIG